MNSTITEINPCYLAVKFHCCVDIGGRGRKEGKKELNIIPNS
jgi:hypothetical protein